MLPEWAFTFLVRWHSSIVAFMTAFIFHACLFLILPSKIFDPSQNPFPESISVEFMIPQELLEHDREKLEKMLENPKILNELMKLQEPVPEDPIPEFESVPPIQLESDQETAEIISMEEREILEKTVFEEPPDEIDLIDEDAEEKKITPAPRLSLNDILEKDEKILENLRNTVSPIQPLDNRFFDFPIYLKNVFRKIDTHFQYASESRDSMLGRFSGIVVLDFTMNSNGKVTNVALIYGNVSQTAKMVCKQVIYAQESYGSWTGEMIEVLGREQTLRVTFEFKL